MRIDRFFTLFCVSPVRRVFCRSNGIKIPILMYHSISNHLDDALHPYYRTVTSPKRFEQQMDFLNQLGYQVLNLSEAVHLLQNASQRKDYFLEKSISYKSFNFQRPTVVITFDDGLQDFYTTAFPILEKFSFKATVFLTSGLINKKFLTGEKCLTVQQIRELVDKGIEFGSHTVTHPQLNNMLADEIIHELSFSKKIIENITNSPVTLFSYPYRFPEEDQGFVRELASFLVSLGYSAGVTTILGTSKPEDNTFFLNRLPVNECDDTQLFQAKLEGDYNWLHLAQFAYKKLKTSLRG